MSKKMTVKELDMKVDDYFSRLDSKIDAMREKGGLAVGYNPDMKKDIEELKTQVTKLETYVVTKTSEHKVMIDRVAKRVIDLEEKAEKKPRWKFW